MKKTIQFILWILIVGAVLFYGYEWWNSFPKVSFAPPLASHSKKEKLDSILIATLNQNQLSGLAVSVIRNSKVTYQKAIGFNELETKDSLKTNTIIPVASISKIFTSLAAANHFQSLGLSVTDPISILEHPLISPESDLGKISFEELLRHESGLKDKTVFDEFFKQKRDQSLDNYVLDFLEGSPKPDRKRDYHYADINFDLLGFLLSFSSGASFDQLVQESVFQQLGMNSSFFNETLIIDRGYRKTSVWKRLKESPIAYQSYPSPSSGLQSSIEDLNNALLQLIRLHLGNMQEELLWLQTDPEKAPAGFQKIEINKQQFIGHFGGQAGFSALLLFHPEEKFGLIILSNTRDRDNFRVNLASDIHSLIQQNP